MSGAEPQAEQLENKELKKLNRDVNVSLRFAIGAFVLLVGGYTFWFWIYNDIPLSTDSSLWGTFGDFVGGILNPMIAFLAFYWLTKSVKIQKTELEATKLVLAETEKATKEQAITQEKKRFEDTFHSLLSQLNTISEQITHQHVLHNKPQESKLEKLHSRIIKNTNHDVQYCSEQMRIHDAECSHYFRVLYQILMFVAMKHDFDNPPESFEEAMERERTESEKFYANIVRSFVNMDATRLLAINCATKDKVDPYYKYRQLIERYEFLEHIRLQNSTNHKDFDSLIDIGTYFDKSAFGKHPTLGVQD
ncbi:TPA: putative phage abortive infection protein [Vibrio diabolicus]